MAGVLETRVRKIVAEMAGVPVGAVALPTVPARDLGASIYGVVDGVTRKFNIPGLAARVDMTVEDIFEHVAKNFVNPTRGFEPTPEERVRELIASRVGFPVGAVSLGSILSRDLSNGEAGALSLVAAIERDIDRVLRFDNISTVTVGDVVALVTQALEGDELKSEQHRDVPSGCVDCARVDSCNQEKRRGVMLGFAAEPQVETGVAELDSVLAGGAPAEGRMVD